MHVKADEASQGHDDVLKQDDEGLTTSRTTRKARAKAGRRRRARLAWQAWADGAWKERALKRRPGWAPGARQGADGAKEGSGKADVVKGQGQGYKARSRTRVKVMGQGRLVGVVDVLPRLRLTSKAADDGKGQGLTKQGKQAAQGKGKQTGSRANGRLAGLGAPGRAHAKGKKGARKRRKLVHGTGWLAKLQSKGRWRWPGGLAWRKGLASGKGRPGPGPTKQQMGGKVSQYGAGKVK